MSAPFPWLEDTWQRLAGYRNADRVPHALLLTGPAGLGKVTLARNFLKLLLCRNPVQDTACDQCDSCAQWRAQSHPDFHEVTLEEDDKGKLRKQIVVDQVRALSAKMSLTARQGGWKLVLVQPADAMNVNAANSLLKTLEEPAPGSLLLLVSSRPANLPATIRSRCQQLAVPRPPAQASFDWLRAEGVSQPELALAYARGVPLRAKALAESDFLRQRGELLQRLAAVQGRGASVVTVAGEFEALDSVAVVEFLDAVTDDLVRLSQLPEDATRLRNPDLLNSLKTLADRVNLTALHRYRIALGEARRLVETPVNPRLLLESLLLPWAVGMNAATNERVLDRLLEG
ncbi:MAG TPA: DNA polymerase III subunit delta' [Gammaproteobacteria bacterium]